MKFKDKQFVLYNHTIHIYVEEKDAFRCADFCCSDLLMEEKAISCNKNVNIIILPKIMQEFLRVK